MRCVTLAIALMAPTFALAQTCEVLGTQFEKYNTAFMYFDRTSKSETSTLRASTAQAAVTNILLRQGMILDMMIAQNCELPAPPDFPVLGLVSSKN
jgi:hypothetical protein